MKILVFCPRCGEYKNIKEAMMRVWRQPTEFDYIKLECGHRIKPNQKAIQNFSK